MKEGQDLRIQVECDYDPLREFSGSLVVLEQTPEGALPTKKGLVLAVSLLRGSSPGVLRPQGVHLWAFSPLKRNAILCACGSMRAFGQSLELSLDLQMVWDPWSQELRCLLRLEPLVCSRLGPSS